MSEPESSDDARDERVVEADESGDAAAFMDMSLLATAARQAGVRLTGADLSRFGQYGTFLLRENATMNLTAITDPAAVQLRHFADSLTVLPLLDEYIRRIGGDVAMLSTIRVVDVGSGAGFPGIPIALVRSRVAVTLIEATGKKVAFLRRVADALDLPNITALTLRAEDAGHDPTLREGADFVTARAVARLSVLAEYCLPLLRRGGIMVALKSGDLTDELAEGTRAAALLGGSPPIVMPVPVPELAGHVLVQIEKTDDTTGMYPRRPGVPAKHPLGVM